MARHGAGSGAGVGARGGFTLMEILIAMVVLMVGLCGIMAVFPHALKSANTTVEKSYAAAISQSVVDAIQLGLREMSTPYEDWQAFVFDHDGCEDLDSDRDAFLRDLNLADLKSHTGEITPQFRTLLRKDYCILLPQATETETLGGSTVGRVYVYPRESPADNEARKAASRDPNTREILYKKVYKLGKALAESQAQDEVTRELERSDPFQQYSFAFTIRVTKGPSAANPTPDRSQQQIVPGLYEVVVSVFRNFDPDPQSRYNKPIERFTTYIGAR